MAGWLINRFGSKRVTAWSTVAFSITLLAPSFAVGGLSLFAGLVLFGAMAGTNDVAINAQGVAVERALEAPTMSRFHAMFSIGGMIGASLGGLLAANQVSPEAHISSSAALFLAISLLTAPFLFDANDRVAEHSRKQSLGRMPLSLLTLAGVAFCMFLSEGAIADWAGVYFRQQLNATAGLAAAAYAVFSAGMAIFRLLGDSITRRLGPVRTVRAGALTAAAGLSLALTASSAGLALTGFALTGAGFSVIVPLVFAAGGRLGNFPSGAGVATVSGSGYIGFLFGPPLIGMVAQGASLRIALFGIVGLSLMAAALANAVDSDRSR